MASVKAKHDASPCAGSSQKQSTLRRANPAEAHHGLLSADIIQVNMDEVKRELPAELAKALLPFQVCTPFQSTTLFIHFC
jgi:hypothetical protein